MNHLVLIVAAVVGVLIVAPVLINAFLVDVRAGEIRFVRRSSGKTIVHRGPCKVVRVPLVGTHWRIPDLPIQVHFEVPVPAAERASSTSPFEPVQATAIVRVGSEDDAMVEAAVDRFFSMRPSEQLRVLPELLSSAAGRAVESTSRASFALALEQYASGELRDFGLCFVDVRLNPAVPEGEASPSRAGNA